MLRAVLELGVEVDEGPLHLLQALDLDLTRACHSRTSHTDEDHHTAGSTFPITPMPS